MNRIYLDNAATTAIDDEVVKAMFPYLTTQFGNPSSVYSYGRENRIAIENARRSVANLLGAEPSEIIFTSCGTESNNMAILAAIRDLGCTHIITSPIEHHAILHTVQHYAKEKNITYSFTQLDKQGRVDINDLEQQLKWQPGTCLITLMQGNNEIGNLLDIEKVAGLCEQYNAVFHSDCVQTVGHYPLQLKDMPIDFIAASAHKFHGPKGAGLLYINKKRKIHPLIFGGGQERNLRAGTENVPGIIGFAKALELAMERYAADSKHILSLKDYMMVKLINTGYDIQFNGDLSSNSLYSVLNVSFPKNAATDMLLFHLDTKGICASGGSACSSSGTSHVMEALGNNSNRTAIRFSFSRYNTKQEIDIVINELKLYLLPAVAETDVSSTSSKYPK